METSQNVKCLRVILHGITGDYFSLLFCNIKMIYKAHVSPLLNGLKLKKKKNSIVHYKSIEKPVRFSLQPIKKKTTWEDTDYRELARTAS